MQLIEAGISFQGISLSQVNYRRVKSLKISLADYEFLKALGIISQGKIDEYIYELTLKSVHIFFTNMYIGKSPLFLYIITDQGHKPSAEKKIKRCMQNISKEVKKKIYFIFPLNPDQKILLNQIIKINCFKLAMTANDRVKSLFQKEILLFND